MKCIDGKALMIWVHPAEFLGFKISIIHHTAVLSRGVQRAELFFCMYKKH